MRPIETLTSDTREEEMQKYGRKDAYKKLEALLTEKRREAFHLVNLAVANLDDLIDESERDDVLPEAISLLRAAFEGKTLPVQEHWQRDVVRLGTLLCELQTDDFPQAQIIFEETSQFWQADMLARDLRNKISDRSRLDVINTELGRAVAVQFLCFFCPEMTTEDKNALATAYGFAIKTADNLSDLEKDVVRGYINIPQEDMGKHRISVMSHGGVPYLQGEIDAWKAAEKIRVENLYAEAELVFNRMQIYPQYTEALTLLKRVFDSWLLECRKSI